MDRACVLTGAWPEGRLWRCASVVVAAAVWLGADAQLTGASTVGVVAAPPGSWAVIDYRAAAGEINRVETTFVGPSEDGVIKVVDPGATIEPTGACRSIDAHTAECSAKALNLTLMGAEVKAGDMDDVVTSVGPGLAANGGPGSDRLDVTSGVAGSLNGGGGGRDTLLGSGNTDTLTDGDHSGVIDSDVLDGRGGGGTVSYAHRLAPVRVDLTDPGGDGEAGEADVLRSINSIEGGSGPDELRGDGRRNSIHGGASADRISGLGGPDFLEGGSGDDLLAGGRGADNLAGGPGADGLSGGAGGDVLFVRRNGPDRASCGGGRNDAVVAPNRRDILQPDCESVYMAYGLGGEDSVEVQPYPRRSGHRYAVFRVGCPDLAEREGEPAPMSGRMSLREAFGRHRLLGAGHIPRDLGRSCGDESEAPSSVPVRIEFTALGRSLVRRAGDMHVTVSLMGRNLPRRAAWTIEVSFR